MRVSCEIAWSAPVLRQAALVKPLPRDHYVYAIVVDAPDSPALIRIGASADIRRRLVGYPVMDEIPGCRVTYAVVSDRFGRRLAPLVRAYFGRRASPRPRFLVSKTLDYCEARELRSIEYKVERLLLEEYCRRQAEIQGSALRKDLLPPGNARAGSSREYLRDIQVVEKGATSVLDRPRALLQPEIADRFWVRR